MDTNILIYFLGGAEPHVSKVEQILGRFMKAQDEGIISIVSVAEVLTAHTVHRVPCSSCPAKTANLNQPKNVINL